MSAYVAAAIEDKAKLDDLSALLDEMLAETGGPTTPAERRAADRALGITKPRKRRSRTSKDLGTYSLGRDGNVVRKTKRKAKTKAKAKRTRR